MSDATPLPLRDLSAVSFMNAYTQGRSGGDVAFIELSRRMDWGTHRIVTSAMGQALCESMGLRSGEAGWTRFILTTRETAFRHLVLTYLLRIAAGCWRAARCPVPNAIIATSDILPDALPALVLRIKGLLTRRRTAYIQKFYHLNQPGRRLSAWAQRGSLLLIGCAADHVITSSQVSAEALARRGMPRSRIAVNPIGIDLEGIRRAPPARERYEGVFLGRLTESKGIFDLPEIWRRVTERHPEARLAVIGGGDAAVRQELEARIVDAGLKRHVHLLGYLDDDAARGIIKSATVFVFPSYEEGFGIALAEAMACGAVPVAFDLPVYRELYGEAVTRARCYDASELGGLVAGLLGDLTRLHHLRALGMEAVQRFSWDAAARREAALIREICREHGILDHRSGQGDQ